MWHDRYEIKNLSLLNLWSCIELNFGEIVFLEVSVWELFIFSNLFIEMRQKAKSYIIFKKLKIKLFEIKPKQKLRWTHN